MKIEPKRISRAAQIMRAAFKNVLGRAPTDWELQTILAQAHLESGFGAPWKAPCNECNNWGAIQCTKAQVAKYCRPGEDYCGVCCMYLTTREDNTWYRWYYRVYNTPAEGAEDLVRVGYTGRRSKVLDAARDGNLYEAVKELKATQYFELPLQDYYEHLVWRSREIAATLEQEPIPLGGKGAGAGVGSAMLVGALALAGVVLILRVK